MTNNEKEIIEEEYIDYELRKAITEYIQKQIPEDMTITPETLEKITKATQIYLETLTQELLELDKYNTPIGIPFKKQGNTIKQEYTEIIRSFNKIKKITQQTSKKYFQQEGMII